MTNTPSKLKASISPTGAELTHKLNCCLPLVRREHIE